MYSIYRCAPFHIALASIHFSFGEGKQRRSYRVFVLGVQFPITDEGKYPSTTTCLSTAYEYCSLGGNVVVIQVFVNLRF
jgi:hypothetical protein